MQEHAFYLPHENSKIFGIFTPGKKEFPLIILVHGWSGNHLGTWNRFFVTAARYFARKGLNVLRFDFRGSGNSEGEFEEQTISSMISDLKAVAEHSSENFDFNGDIVLIGHSQGFYISVFASRKISEIKGLISWMGRVSDLRDLWPRVWFEEFERKGYLISEDFVISRKYVEDSLKYRSPKIIGKLNIPVLLVYGAEDSVVPPSEGLKFMKLYRGSDITLKIIPGLDHYFYGDKIKARVLKLTFAWIRKRFL